MPISFEYFDAITKLKNRDWEELTRKPEPEKITLFQSEYHKGECCSSCYAEYEDDYMGGGVMADGYCCCRDERI